MGSEIKSSVLDLGFVIAFVAPGFVAFPALSYHMPAAGAWMDAASKADQGVGVFLFVLLASLAMGLIVSGVRALTVDNLLFCQGLPQKLRVQKPAIKWGELNGEKLTILVTVRNAFYRHYQFYSNTLVALVFWTACRATADRPSLACWQWVAIGAGIGALLFSARDSLSRYGEAVRQLFEPKKKE